MELYADKFSDYLNQTLNFVICASKILPEIPVTNIEKSNKPLAAFSEEINLTKFTTKKRKICHQVLQKGRYVLCVITQSRKELSKTFILTKKMKNRSDKKSRNIFFRKAFNRYLQTENHSFNLSEKIEMIIAHYFLFTRHNKFAQKLCFLQYARIS